MIIVKNTDIVLRGYERGDEARVNEMFKEVFKKGRDLSHWYWKYRDNPYGSYCISLAFAKDGRLAAHYGGYPVMLYFQPSKDTVPEESLTYHIGDKMTRREFRARGFGRNSVLARTFRHFRDVYGRGRGVSFAYGFTTGHSRRFGLLLLDYADIEPVTYRRISIEGLKTMRAKPIKRLFSRLRVEEVREVDKQWSDFFYEVAPDYQYLVKRDVSYLRWRYLRRPDRRYLILEAKRGGELCGWSVFYREDNRVIWGDALFRKDDLDNVRAIFDYLCVHSYVEGADFIECWFPPRPGWWNEILKEIGFKESQEPNGLHLTPPVFEDAEEVTKRLKRYFYYTIGDSDLF